MNYTVTISISHLLAPQKTLKFRISVGPSEVLVRPSNLHPSVSVYGNISRNVQYYSTSSICTHLYVLESMYSDLFATKVPTVP